MGKGGYSGGSSIITSSGWFSRGSSSDVGRDREVITPHKEEEEEPQTLGQVTRRKPKKPRIPRVLDAARIEELTVGYLGHVISAHLARRQPSKMPKELEAIIQPEILAAGDVVSWAKRHPKFEDLMSARRPMKGLGKKSFAVSKLKNGSLVVSDEGSEADDTIALEELIGERDRLAVALDAAVSLAQECRAKIKRLDAAIAAKQLGL